MARRKIGFGVVLAGMVLVAMLMGSLLIWGLIRWVEPNPVAPDLAGKRPESVTTHMAGPDDEPPEPPAAAEAEPIFDEHDVCPLDVVLEPEDDQPIDEAYVRATMSWGSPMAGERFEADRLEPLTWRVEDLPCGVASLRVTVSGYVPVRRDAVDSVVQSSVTVPLTRGVFLRGVVTDQDGAPIAEAWVKGDNVSDHTDEEGAYRLRVDPAELRRVYASAEGYLSDSQRLRLPEDTVQDAVLDFELAAAREVTVWCAGLPDDSCASVLPIMCTWALLPVGPFCMGDPVRCECPDGRVAVRAGGQSVEVGPDEREAWLDFRDTGSIVGRVVRSGEPVECDIIATFAPRSMADLSEGLFNARKAETDDEGRFLLAGLNPGTWTVQVMDDSGPAATEYTKVLEGQRYDLGEIDLMGGGLIQGVVIDALTEQGAPREMVMAIRTDIQTELPAMQMAHTGSEGRFELRGLDDGTYKVSTTARPFTHDTVILDDGVADHEVELTTGAAGLLDEQGFSLVTDQQGELMVDGVEPGGLADGAGLRAGDVVSGVLIGGIDLGMLIPGLDDYMVEAVLEHYSGPGVSLVVLRDGAEVTVELD